MPPKKQTMLIKDDQPATLCPKANVINDHIIPAKLIKAIIKPMAVISRIGFVDRLVIPSIASASIFLSG